MPQFWLEDFPPQLVWLAISFAILYVLMAKLALPRIAEVLEQRQERIASDLDRAQALRDQAEKVLAEYEAALAEARSEAQAILAESSASFAAVAERRNAEVGELLARQTEEATARIAEAKTQAMGEVRTVAAELATAAAHKLIGDEIPQNEAADAVADAMRQVR